ncbi:MAG: lysophospholipid acyltransferase family protein [Elusimicrobia bacterium]|nr:lysophospholipid acyltransferase family protein [Elusimicrobiota bacterium]MDD7579066.1 lysophospholipid acyltransferase family protein [Elusimicrobiota bacterium]MDY6039884.1 lysophospholipid acyltransferase family protein [Elusimicrobiaceae bacterium]
MLLNLIKLIARVYFRTFYDFKVEGLENIPKTGALIIAGNHLSNADPPAIGSFAGLVRDSRFVAKKELFSVPGLGWFFRRSGYIPVDRARTIGDFGALKEVVRALEQGQSVVMFPEGTRSKTGKPQKPKSGIGFLVYKTGAPVLPVKVEGTFGWPWVRKIRVKFGTVIHLEKDPALEPKAQYKQFANEVMEAINSIHI